MSRFLYSTAEIRAIEARTMLGGKATPDAQRELVDSSMREGYILTQYFYEVFTKFEKDPAGLRDAYAEMLSNLDVAGEHRRASQVQFAAQATPELLAGSRPQPQPMLRLAEQKLALGDTGGAQKLAQQILDEKKEDAGHALFILARIATANRDLEGARTYFERTLDISHEPRLVAWSHIYLGRLLDIQEERESAVEHYRLALQAGDASPAVKSAAEKGIKQPYEPPTAAREQAQ